MREGAPSRICFCSGTFRREVFPGWRRIDRCIKVGASSIPADPMNATKALAISMAGATALVLGVLTALDEPSGAASLPSVTQPRQMALPRAEDGRMLRDVDRQAFRSHWPLVEDKATLTCRPKGIATVITSSGEYGLSGLAIAAGYPSIWDAVLPVELRRDAALAPLVTAALALCPAIQGGEPSRGMGMDEPAVGGFAKPRRGIDSGAATR